MGTLHTLKDILPRAPASALELISAGFLEIFGTHPKELLGVDLMTGEYNVFFLSLNVLTVHCLMLDRSQLLIDCTSFYKQTISVRLTSSSVPTSLSTRRNSCLPTMLEMTLRRLLDVIKLPRSNVVLLASIHGPILSVPSYQIDLLILMLVRCIVHDNPHQLRSCCAIRVDDGAYPQLHRRTFAQVLEATLWRH